MLARLSGRCAFPVMIRKAMGKIIALIMLVALIATPIATLFFLSAHTRLAFDPQPHDIGVSTWVGVRVSNPHGTRDLTARIEQNGMQTTLMQTKAKADRLKFWLAQVPD